MVQLNIKEARSHFSTILNQVEAGQEVVIMRRGKAVARIVPFNIKSQTLPDLQAFRASLHIIGEPMSKIVIQGRTEERS
jgi:prevent-host-death family protein